MATHKDPVRGLTWRYIIALLILASLATGAMLLLQATLQRQSAMIDAIARTELQGRLVKDTILAARQMVDARTPVQLQIATLRLEQNIARLDHDLSRSGPDAPTGAHRHLDDPALIARHWRVFRRAALAMAQDPPGKLTPYHEALPVLDREGAIITSGLDAAAARQINAHAGDTRRTRKLALAVWSGTLLAQLLIGLRLFRPMARRIKSSIAALRRAMIRVKREQEALEVANTLLKAELDAAPHGVVAFDPNGRLLSHNARFLELWGFDEAEMPQIDSHRLFRQIHTQCLSPETVAQITRTILENENIVYTDIMTLADGRSFERTARPLLGAGGRLMGRIWFFRDQSEQSSYKQDQLLTEDSMARNAAELARLVDELYLAKAEAEQVNATLEAQQVELERLAGTDSLTELANRRSFFECAREGFAKPRSDAPLSVIMIDIDHFKQLNDQWGHEAGDRALIAVAQILNEVTGADALPARIGGEEFAVLLCDSHLTLAIGLAEQIRMQISALRLPVGEESASLTASMGVAQRAEQDQSFDMLLNRADSALYDAKRTGRNRVIVSNGTAGDAAPPAAARREERSA